MKIAAIITARVASTRLSRKVLADLAGIPLVAHVIRRSGMFPMVGEGGDVILAIPAGSENDPLEAVGDKFDAKIVRGDEDDVLGRILLAADSVGADVIYRITGDNPLIDVGVVSETWSNFNSGDWDYTVMEDTPLGTTAEVVTVDALRQAYDIANNPPNPVYREHPTLALYENPDRFRMQLIPPPDKWRRPDWRFTVDTIEDFKVVESILNELGENADLDSIVPFIEANPEVIAVNMMIEQDGWTNLKNRKNVIGHV